jgi:hypothetical protein
VNENIITVNINHLIIKITAIWVYAPSNDKANAEKYQFYEKLNETLVKISMREEKIDLEILMAIRVQK